MVNLGAFAVIIAVSRRTGSGEISSWGGLFAYAPGLSFAMAIFLFALGGIPPAAGWFAKFQLFQAVITPGTAAGYSLAVVMAVNSVLSLAYYLGVMRAMFFDDVPDGDVSPLKVPSALLGAISLSLVATLVVGVLPHLVLDLADKATFARIPGL